MKGPDMKALELADERAATLEAHFGAPNATLQPIITSLNGDDSWLLSIPAPEGSGHAQHYFHVVIDPWLTGPAYTVGSWFLTTTHEAPPAVKDGAGVEAVARQIDAAADAALGPPPPPVVVPTAAAAGDDDEVKWRSSSSSRLGLIVTASFVEDHSHPPTLRTFDTSIPVITTPEAVRTVRGLKHFDRVAAMPELWPAKGDPSGRGDWQAMHPGAAALPPWLSVFRVSGGGLGPVQNWGICIVWASSSSTETGGTPQYQGVLHSGHGVDAAQPAVQALVKADPPISFLAMLHSLVDGWSVGLKATTGVSGGLALERALRPRCWIESHNSDFKFTGGFTIAITNIPRTIEDGLVEEAKKNGGQEGRRPNFLQVKNGSSYVMA